MIENINKTLQELQSQPERLNGIWTPWGRFAQHRRDARKRGILFELTFSQWWKVWQRSGYWKSRGSKKDQYVMARFGDKGPYSTNNVEIIRCERNHYDGNIGKARPKDEVWRQNLSNKHKGKILSRAHKAKIRQTCRTNGKGGRRPLPQIIFSIHRKESSRGKSNWVIWHLIADKFDVNWTTVRRQLRKGQKQ